MNPRRSAAALAAVMLLVACSSDADKGADTTTQTPATAPTDTTVATDSTVPTLAPATFALMPGTEQVAVLQAEPGAALSVRTVAGDLVASGTVDAQGALLFRNLAPGEYVVQSDTESSDTFQVADPSDVPPQALYDDQALLPAGGFGYITVRDGTTLSANVILPGPADAGPYPTVVEYSGYQPSDPDSAQLAALYTTQGFAYVGVNMRGTGCSGGSFRFFETVQSLDGYDVVEAVAAQPWVMDNEVGMVGISYPGISQLFVAATQPPSLNSITPLSVLDDSFRSTLYPGGILNTGFAVDWTQQRVDNGKPYGQEWTRVRADGGDKVCADNQLLRLQNPDLVAEIDENPYYANPLGDSLAPITFVDRIEVPIFIAGAWQDEQTGGHFANMLASFTSSPHVFATLTNGLHTESLSPPVAGRYMEFLQLYVGKKVPDLSAGAALASALGGALWGVSTFAPLESRFTGMTYASCWRRARPVPPPTPTPPATPPTRRRCPPRSTTAPTRAAATVSGVPTCSTTGGRCPISPALASSPRRFSPTGSSPVPARSTCGCRQMRPTPTWRSRSARFVATARRSTCRAAGCAPASGRSTRPPAASCTRCTRTPRTMPPTFPPTSSCPFASTCSPSPIRSGPAAGSGSRSTPPATVEPSGSSAPSATVRPSRSLTTRSTRRGSCSPWSR